jgi:hypothetical protein
VAKYALTDRKGLLMIRKGLRQLELFTKSNKVRQSGQTSQSAAYEAGGWFQVTGELLDNGFYPASTIFRDAKATSDNGKWYSEDTEDFYVQGVNYEPLEEGMRYRGFVIDEDVGTPQAFTDTVYVSDTQGTLTVGIGHNITVGDQIDVIWSGGRRDRMTVTAVDGTTVDVTGGTGDDFPADDTTGNVVALASGAARLPAAIVTVEKNATVTYQKIYIDDGSSGAGAVATTVSAGIYKGYIYENNLDGTWTVGDEVRVGLLGGTCYINQKVYTCVLNGAVSTYDKYWNAGNYHILVDACDPDTQEPITNLWLLGEHTLVLNDVDPDALPGGLT